MSRLVKHFREAPKVFGSLSEAEQAARDWINAQKPPHVLSFQVWGPSCPYGPDGWRVTIRWGQWSHLGWMA